MTLGRTLPEVGSVWRERRRMYASRTARVVEVDPLWPGGFVFIQTLTPINQQHRKPTRVGQRLWHQYWEPA